MGPSDNDLTGRDPVETAAVTGLGARSTVPEAIRRENTMFQRILVPLDGSALAEEALHYGADVASRYGVRLTLLRAFDGPRRSLQLLAQMPMMAGVRTSNPHRVEQAITAAQDAEAESRTYLAGHQQHLTARALVVDTLVADADAAEVILKES